MCWGCGFKALQEAQLELAIELVDRLIDCLQYRNSTISMGMQRKLHTIHIYTLCRFVHFTLTGCIGFKLFFGIPIVELSGLGRTWSWWSIRTRWAHQKCWPGFISPSVWPYLHPTIFVFCFRPFVQDTVKCEETILWHFLLILFALQHRHRPIFPLNIVFFRRPQWNWAGQQRCFCPWLHWRHHGCTGRFLGDYFYHCDLEEDAAFGLSIRSSVSVLRDKLKLRHASC